MVKLKAWLIVGLFVLTGCTYFATKSKHDKTIFDSKIKKTDMVPSQPRRPVQKVEIAPTKVRPLPPEAPEEVVAPSMNPAIGPMAPESNLEEEPSWWQAIFG